MLHLKILCFECVTDLSQDITIHAEKKSFNVLNHSPFKGMVIQH